jgi:(4S)-4-hydroxy-5-phosphonooxypentane-2,3-dione isomerase
MASGNTIGCTGSGHHDSGLSFGTHSPNGRDMLIVHVHVHVKAEWIDAFKSATVTNARESRKEAGVVRFEILQQEDDPANFVLEEIYRDTAAAAAHKETRHYPIWRDAVAPMMAESRRSVKFSEVPV